METPGQRLKKIRLEKGITFEEAHKKTKIHLNILKAIEEDSVVNFSPIYLKGFLKIYCNFLGIDPKEYIITVKEKETQKAPIENTAQKTRDVLDKPFAAIKKRSVLRNELLKKLLVCVKKIIPVIVILAVIIGSFKIGKFVFNKVSLLAKKTKLSSKITPPKKEKKLEKKNKPKQSPEQIPAVSFLPAAEISSGVRLGVRARDDCWMRVKLDGKTVFQAILKRGKFENWQAKEKIEVSLGKAEAVEFEVNGKLIENLARRGQSVKNILITKEGLNITR